MRILKIESLPTINEAWVDRDTIMLHACFQILQDCVETEGLLTHCNYESHKNSVDEAKALYEWWLVRKERENDFNDDKIMEVDDAMLLRLMKIRGFLWT